MPPLNYTISLKASSFSSPHIVTVLVSDDSDSRLSSASSILTSTGNSAGGSNGDESA